MNVIIFCDTEGASGISVVEQILPEHALYAEGRRLYTEDVNAAVRGVVAAGAERVVVREFHGGPNPYGLNHLIPDSLDEHIEWVSHHFGPEQPFLYDTRFEAAVIIGAHAMAGTPDGILAHTITGGWNGVWLNEQPVGEIEIFARMLGAFDIPVVAVTGDTAACREAAALLPDVTCVAVKQGYTFNSGLLIAPQRARQLIETGVKMALQNMHRIKPLPVIEPARFLIDFKEPGDYVQAMAQLPNATLLDATHLRFETETYLSGVNRLFGWPG